MTNRQSIRLFVLIAFLIPGLAWAIVNFYESKGKLPVIGPTAFTGKSGTEHRITDFELINQDGSKKSFHDWKGQIIVANFFFSHCPVVCPKMTSNLKKINTHFKQYADVHLISITVDPIRDSAAQLKNFTNRFSIDTRNWDLLTGNKKEIYRLARNSFMVVATDGDGGPNDFIHSDKLVLIDRLGRIRGFYDGTEEAAINKLSHDIKKLQNEQ